MEPHPEAMQESEQAVPAEGLGLDSQEPVDHPLPGLEDPLNSDDNPNLSLIHI